VAPKVFKLNSRSSMWPLKVNNRQGKGVWVLYGNTLLSGEVPQCFFKVSTKCEINI